MFLMQDTAMEDLELQLDAALRPLFSTSVATGVYDRLAEYPWVATHRMPALGSAGTSSGGAVTGGVRLSTLDASRGIPARVTFVVGLTEGEFPRFGTFVEPLEPC
jgi:superfamily I DNA/RNA helicase